MQTTIGYWVNMPFDPMLRSATCTDAGTGLDRRVSNGLPSAIRSNRVAG